MGELTSLLGVPTWYILTWRTCGRLLWAEVEAEATDIFPPALLAMSLSTVVLAVAWL